MVSMLGLLTVGSIATDESASEDYSRATMVSDAGVVSNHVAR